MFFEKEVPFELRLEDTEGPQEVASFEAIMCKLFKQGEPENPEQVRLEITCENDLFFHFTHELDEETFKNAQENQKLCINFSEYANLMKKLLNNCINEPHSYIAVLIMQQQETARLDFIQNIEYKFIELLSVDFVNSQDAKLKDTITYRYNSLKQRLNVTNEKIQAICELVKKKNPTLNQMITKLLEGKTNLSQINHSRYGK